MHVVPLALLVALGLAVVVGIAVLLLWRHVMCTSHEAVDKALKIGASVVELVKIKQDVASGPVALPTPESTLAWLFHTRALNRYAAIVTICHEKPDNHEAGFVVGRSIFEMLVILKYVQQDSQRRLPAFTEYARWRHYEYLRKMTNVASSRSWADSIRQSQRYQQLEASFGGTKEESARKKPDWPGHLRRIVEELEAGDNSLRWCEWYTVFYASASSASHVGADWITFMAGVEDRAGKEEHVVSPIGKDGRALLGNAIVTVVGLFLLLMQTTCEILGFSVSQQIDQAMKEVVAIGTR